MWRSLAPDRTGVYFFLRGTSRAGALLVNPEPAESQLRRLDDATMARRIRGAIGWPYLPCNKADNGIRVHIDQICIKQSFAPLNP